MASREPVGSRPHRAPPLLPSPWEWPIGISPDAPLGGTFHSQEIEAIFGTIWKSMGMREERGERQKNVFTEVLYDAGQLQPAPTTPTFPLRSVTGWPLCKSGWLLLEMTFSITAGTRAGAACGKSASRKGEAKGAAPGAAAGCHSSPGGINPFCTFLSAFSGTKGKGSLPRSVARAALMDVEEKSGPG